MAHCADPLEHGDERAEWPPLRPLLAGGLLGLAVLGVLPAARAELVEGHSVRIVALVLFGVIRPLATIRTGEGDQHPVSFPSHRSPFYFHLNWRTLARRP